MYDVMCHVFCFLPSTLRLWNAYDKKKPQLQVIKARDRQGNHVTLPPPHCPPLKGVVTDAFFLGGGGGGGG